MKKVLKFLSVFLVVLSILGCEGNIPSLLRTNNARVSKTPNQVKNCHLNNSCKKYGQASPSQKKNSMETLKKGKKSSSKKTKKSKKSPSKSTNSKQRKDSVSKSSADTKNDVGTVFDADKAVNQLKNMYTP